MSISSSFAGLAIFEGDVISLGFGKTGSMNAVTSLKW
jgi:hypothetical protein